MIAIDIWLRFVLVGFVSSVYGHIPVCMSVYECVWVYFLNLVVLDFCAELHRGRHQDFTIDEI